MRYCERSRSSRRSCCFSIWQPFRSISVLACLFLEEEMITYFSAGYWLSRLLYRSPRFACRRSFICDREGPFHQGKKSNGSELDQLVRRSIVKLTPVPFWLVGSEKSEGRGGSEKREQSEQHERAKQRTKRHSRVRRKRKDQAGRCSQSSDPKQGGV